MKKILFIVIENPKRSRGIHENLAHNWELTVILFSLKNIAASRCHLPF